MTRVHLEGHLWKCLDEQGRPAGYLYRRTLGFYDKGIRKYQDIRKRLGTNLIRAVADAKRFDAQYDDLEHGGDPRVDVSVKEFWDWYVNHVRHERGLLGWKTMRDATLRFVQYVSVNQNGETREVPLRRITQADLAKFFLDLKQRPNQRTGQPLSQATIHTCFRHVRRMFRVAREHHFLDADQQLPIEGVRVPAPKVQEPRLPRPDQLPRLLEQLKANHRPSYRFALLCLFTGGREAEVTSLRWERVGFVKPVKDGTITLIRRKVNDQLVIPMADGLQRELFAWWLEAGQPLDGFLFRTREGGPVAPQQAYKAFKREVRRLGPEFAWLRPKDFRKLAATIPDMWDAVRLLGHTSPQMTADHYRGHWMTERARAVKSIEKALGMEAPESSLALFLASDPASKKSEAGDR